MRTSLRVGPILTQRLLRFMKEHNLTQAEFAAQAGLSQPIVSRFCSGVLRPISAQTLRRFAAVLGLTPDELREQPDALTAYLDRLEEFCVGSNLALPETWALALPGKRMDPAALRIPRELSVFDPSGELPHSPAWNDTAPSPSRAADNQRKPLSRLQSEHPRLCIFGEAGSGKTTLLHGLLAHYVAAERQQRPAALHDSELPGLFPLLLVCRELDNADGAASLVDALRSQWQKMELTAPELAAVEATALDRCRRGRALLCIDGLDEVADLRGRRDLLQSLTRFVALYPKVRLVLTSRPLGSETAVLKDFYLANLAPVSYRECSEFVDRWCRATDPEHAPALHARILNTIELEQLHALAGNPLFLTAIVLVVRASGDLPARRAELLQAMLEVLLQWKAGNASSRDRRAMLRRLAYVACGMIRHRKTVLSEDELRDLLVDLKLNYGHPDLERYSEQEWVRILTTRTGILVRSTSATFRFQHYLFQQHLAGLALQTNCYPGRDFQISFAKNLNSLVSGTPPDRWSEPLRALLGLCEDDEKARQVIEVLCGEEPGKSSRWGAITAAQALLEETWLNKDTTERILIELTEHFGKGDKSDGLYSSPDSPMNRLILALAETHWARPLGLEALDKYRKAKPEDRIHVGGLLGFLAGYRSTSIDSVWIERQIDRLCAAQDGDSIAAALSLWPAANYGWLPHRPRLVRRLLDMLDESQPAAHAAAVLLFYMQDRFLLDSGGMPSHRRSFCRRGVWSPSPEEVERLVNYLARPERLEALGAARFALGIVLEHPFEVKVQSLIEQLKDQDKESLFKGALQAATGWQGDRKTLLRIVANLQRQQPVSALAWLPVGVKEPWDRVLLSRDHDGSQPYEWPMSECGLEEKLKRVKEAFPYWERKDIENRLARLRNQLGLS